MDKQSIVKNRGVTLEQGNTDYNKVKIKKEHIIVAIIIGALNILFYDNLIVSLTVVVVECLALFYQFMKRRIVNYLGYYLIFLSLSLEFDILVGSSQFYGFKNFRIFGINIALIMLLPIIYLMLVRNIRIREIKKISPTFYKLIIIFSILVITGIFFALVQILLNDNNLLSLDSVFGIFLGNIYNSVVIPSLIVLFFINIVIFEIGKLYELKSFLLSILIALDVTIFIALITGQYGYYGGLETLLLPITIIYTPFLILPTLYTRGKTRIILILIWIISGAVLLLFNSSGKLIIMYLLLPFIILILSARRKKIFTIFITIFITTTIGIFGLSLINTLSNNNILFSIKYNQAISLIKFWSEDWIIKMPMSPRLRIIEFINIVYEYLEKPWYLIMGKGYLGTITDHSSMMGTTYIPGSFTLTEWTNGVFYGVHETLNLLFLNHGLFGIFILIVLTYLLISQFHKSSWLIIGVVWFVLFYGYSLTLSSFGLSALLIGIIELDYFEINKKAKYNPDN